MKKYFLIIGGLLISVLINTLCNAHAHPKEYLTVHFASVSVRDAINILARYCEKNVVLSPAIRGVLSLNLDRVTCQQAMKAITHAHVLSQKENEGVLYVMPKSENVSQKIPDIETHLIHLHDAQAKEMIKLFKEQESTFLSKEEAIAFDERTNSLIVRAGDTHFSRINEFVQKLDIPITQVLIEARIVKVDENCERELGLQFHGSSQKEADSKGLQFDFKNLPTKTRGLAWARLNDHILLDLELSALESEGRAEIISTPRLITAHQQTAVIESGEEVPYQRSITQGVTATSFKKAVLSLQVTPQVMSSHKINLNLKIHQDKRSGQEVLGMPAISTHQLETQVSVKDGETIVLGGVYEHMTTHHKMAVPFLSDLPLLGVLFESVRTINERRELLIFVTPRIMK